MTSDDYERHVIGQLCWVCHEATRPSHLQQRRCPRCLRKWSFRHRSLEWGLIKAFALGVAAHRAAQVIGCRYPAAHRTFMECRQALYSIVVEERKPLLAALKVSAGDTERKRGRHGEKSRNKALFGIVDWEERVCILEAPADAEAIATALQARNLPGLIVAADTLTTVRDLTRGRGRKARQAEGRGLTRAEAFRRQVVTLIRLQARGVAAKNLGLYLAECEFRRNHGHRELLECLCPSTG